ncbi:hypothetical protein ACJMK2_018673 [Sinanodonta woodiana]|uniref:Transposase n=1 Tax=Sinanodonta woodiana TaxID=1069815 RepID=A0ABD3UE43_SINWO
MFNAMDTAFLGCSRKLCSKHVHDSILRQMTDKSSKSKGVATTHDYAAFKERNIKLKNNLEEQRHGDFLQYYIRHVEQELAYYIISSGEDQHWTNNSTESMNHRFKVKLDREPRRRKKKRRTG